MRTPPAVPGESAIFTLSLQAGRSGPRTGQGHLLSGKGLPFGCLAAVFLLCSG